MSSPMKGLVEFELDGGGAVLLAPAGVGAVWEYRHGVANVALRYLVDGHAVVFRVKGSVNQVRCTLHNG